MRPAVLTLALLLAPQLQPQQAGTTGQGASAIEGVVLKSTTGQPLKRALITAQRIGPTRLVTFGGAMEPEQHTARSDAAGHFVLQNLAPGEYNLWVNRDGYLGMGYGQEVPNGPGKTLKLEPAQQKTDLVFRLIPTGAIVGRVYDEDGEPISGVSVQALRPMYNNGRREFSGLASSPTNDLGEYRLAGLAPGRYYVGAIYNNPGDENALEAYAPVYYPGASDPGGAAQAEVRAGEETPVDLNLSPVPAVRVRGQVVSAALNRPGVGMNVMLFRQQAGWTYSPGQARFRQPLGTFEISNVPPGSYTIMAQLWDNAGKQYSAREPLEVGNTDVEGITLQPGPGAEVRGQVRVESKAPAGLGGLQVYLQPRDQAPIGVQPATVEADGSFVLKDVPAGPYALSVCCLPQDLYLKAARLGGDDVLDAGLTMGQGPPAGSLEIVVGAAGGHIEGVVRRDQKPFQGAVVALTPDASRRTQIRLYSTATSDPQGRFELGSIRPGDYELFAWEKAEDGAYMDPDFVSRYEGRGKTERVDEGSKLNVDLDLIPAEEKREAAASGP